MIAIYYPLKARLSYWDMVGTTRTIQHLKGVSERQARLYLTQRTIETELVQKFEIYQPPTEDKGQVEPWKE